MKFLITSLTSWDEIPRARHQVTEELLRAGHEVFFVEKNRVGVPRIVVTRTRPGLTLVTPFFPLDYRFRFRLPFFNEVYQLWIFRELKKAYGNILVVNFDFTMHLLGKFFKNNIYYCNDEYVGNSKYPVCLINWYHQFAEKLVVQHARFCIATSAYLTRKLSKINQFVYPIPLGGPRFDAWTPKRNFRKKGKITVGLMGAIKLGHVSPKIINRLLKEEDVELVFIGAVAPDFVSMIDGMDHIDAKGVLTGDELYQEMASFDVAIAPYDCDKINDGVTPNKLYQYLACGCPVVITAIPNVTGDKYPQGTVYIANDENEFVSDIRRAFSEDCPEYFQARLEDAARNTWEKRVQVFLSLMEKHHLIDSMQGDVDVGI